VTLAQRLLLATAILTIATTATVGYGVREAWRRAEERRVHPDFRAALELTGQQLEFQSRVLQSSIAPLCAHDPLIDNALTGLVAGDLKDRALPLSLMTAELAKGRVLDELWLVNQRGEVLGAHQPALVGRREPEIAATIVRIGARAEVRASRPQALLAGCQRKSPQNPRVWIGLLAARHLDPVLAPIAKATRTELSLNDPPPDPNAMFERVSVPGQPDLRVTAMRPRLPIAEALRELDITILVIGGFTISLALVAAFLLSRGLARPMVELARQAREVMQGEPRRIVADGPREIEESAAAFNRAIDDLIALRTRLAATERIAAWREIARRVAHEIKNPLAPIRAAIETLRRLRARDDPAFDEYFDEATSTALAEVNRIAHIVTEFTEFARLPPPNPAPVDLVEVARQVVALHANLDDTVEPSAPNAAATHKKIALFATACPEIRADRDQIVQVLTNLVQNALDAVSTRPDGHVVVEVGRSADGRARVTVRDNGPGVPPEMRERLFVPYATTKAKGTGLGLAIAQRLIVEHDGEIGYRDNDGAGAAFFFELPVEGPRAGRPAENPLVPGPSA
jgi:signal transduction histidine kinase